LNPSKGHCKTKRCSSEYILYHYHWTLTRAKNIISPWSGRPVRWLTLTKVLEDISDHHTLITDFETTGHTPCADGAGHQVYRMVPRGVYSSTTINVEPNKLDQTHLIGQLMTATLSMNCELHTCSYTSCKMLNTMENFVWFL